MLILSYITSKYYIEIRNDEVFIFKPWILIFFFLNFFFLDRRDKKSHAEFIFNKFYIHLCIFFSSFYRFFLFVLLFFLFSFFVPSYVRAFSQIIVEILARPTTRWIRANFIYLDTKFLNLFEQFLRSERKKKGEK